MAKGTRQPLEGKKEKGGIMFVGRVNEWFDGASAGELVINSADLNLPCEVAYLRRLPPRTL